MRQTAGRDLEAEHRARVSRQSRLQVCRTGRHRGSRAKAAGSPKGVAAGTRGSPASARTEVILRPGQQEKSSRQRKGVRRTEDAARTEDARRTEDAGMHSRRAMLPRREAGEGAILGLHRKGSQRRWKSG